MTLPCPTIDDAAFLDSALRFIDCQAQTLGSAGYQALAQSGSMISMLLTGLLTIFIAIVGYRLLIGESLEVRDGILATVKIGIVLAIATSWPAYRTLIYDVALHGPAELVSEIDREGNLPGSGGGMVARLQQVDRAFIVLGQYGPGGPGLTAPEPPSIFSAFALGTARLVFLTATIASFASVRLIAGLLLALTPFFIAFLLFAGTRSIFEGWVKTLAAAAIGAVSVTVILGVELALLEPWLANLIALRQAQISIGGAATELLVVSLAFSLALLAGLGMAARLMIGFRLPETATLIPARVRRALSTLHRFETSQPNRQHAPAEQRSRASAIADAVAEVQRRESQGAPRLASVSTSGAVSSTTRATALATPLGTSHRRRSSTRVSASAQRRDKIL